MTRFAPVPVYMQVLTWVLLFPLLYFSARGMFSFDRAQYANNAGVDLANMAASDSDTMYFRIERFAAYGIVMAAIGLSLRGTIQAAKKNLSIFVLPALAIVSTGWSQEPSKTAPLAIMALLLTAFAVYLSHRFEESRLIDLVNVAGIASTLSSYLLIAFVPSAGIRHVDASGAWQGLFVHKNVLGVIMVFFFAAGRYTETRSSLTQFFHKTYMAAILILIAMSQSRTAWIELILLVGYFVFESHYIRVGKMERSVAAATIAVALLAVVAIAINFGGDIAVALGKTSDMTGRTEIFQVLYPELWKRPILGFGYQAFWLGLKGESANVLLTPGHATVANAENGILQMWLELGVVGTAAVVIFLLQAFRNATVCLAHNPSKFARWNCAIVFLSLLGAINGDKFMYPDTMVWVFFVLAYANLANEVRRTRVGVDEARQVAWAS